MKTNDLATFDTRAEAQAIVDTLDQGVYRLGHGEYARPHYTARKVRGVDRYYIHARRYYYGGTLRAIPSGGLEWTDNELYRMDFAS